VELNRITILNQAKGDCRRIDTDVSWLNQSGGGGISFCDKPAALDGSSNKIRAA